jgi:hypothetical protein
MTPSDPNQMPDDADDAGEMMSIDVDNSVEDTEDGGALVRFDDEDETETSPDHFVNLAEVLPDSVLSSVATELHEKVNRDKEARKKRDEQYEEGLRRTGLGDDAPGGAQFDGASRVVHPLLTEAAVDFAARALKELLPPDGPVKTKIPGEITQKKLDKAERKKRYMNWQLTDQMSEFRPELEQTITQVPLGGAQYLKLYWDARLKRPRSMFVPIDDMYLPFAATSFETAERRTHVQYITDLEYNRRVASGMYRDVDLVPDTQIDQTGPAKANDKIEGRTQDPYNDDGLRTILEIYCYAEIEDDDDEAAPPSPYVVTIDDTTRSVLSIYRNWAPEDERREELRWFVEFPFIPWRGAYPIGLPHMIGGLSGAATGALRALLDSAHISNSQTLLRMRSAGKGGQSMSIDPASINELEAPLNVDDIRKAIMPLPYNPPSAVLMTLLGFMVDAGKGVVRTSFDKLGEMNANQPVGTTLALIEQGMTVFSSIHGRLHAAMGRVLRILHRINRTYLEESEVYDDTGEIMARRSDFEGPLDVVPVSDPNIFSDVQRHAQISLIAQRAAAMPQLYDLRKVEEMILEQSKIPDAARRLLLPKPEPELMNPVNENVAATMGRPIVAFPDQDHAAHIKVHLDFLMSPVFGQNPAISPTFIAPMIAHLRDHIALWYVNAVFSLTSEAAGTDIAQLMDPKDPEVNQNFDRMLAVASDDVIMAGSQALGELPPILQQAIQYVQSMQPRPTDPGQVQMQALQQRAQSEAQRAQMDQQKLMLEQQETQQRLMLEQQEIQRNAQLDQVKMQERAMQHEADFAREQMRVEAEAQREAERQASEDQRTAAEITSRERINTQDNDTAMRISSAEILTGDRSNLSTGTGINPNP